MSHPYWRPIMNSNYSRTLTFLIVPNISSFIPEQLINRSKIKIPRNTKLADPTFHRPAPIEMLLGAGTAISVFCLGQINLSPPNGPDLYYFFGWVIGGSVPTISATHATMCHSITALQTDFIRFWEIEEESQIHRLSDVACEEHRHTHTIRNFEGRLLSFEIKLQKDPDLKQQSHAVLQEYLDLGHLSETKPQPSKQECNKKFHLPNQIKGRFR
ncbi:unnamed protein product [Heterotrigona itama]|uniref:Uncharacterized protein n=1 Tax=Heterotrigona itama TaxID=395501 RepID=A0A6V7HA34_9HYME|nr:unnamed protein product [Heterotrigona itama]